MVHFPPFVLGIKPLTKSPDLVIRVHTIKTTIKLCGKDSIVCIHVHQCCGKAVLGQELLTRKHPPVSYHSSA